MVHHMYISGKGFVDAMSHACNTSYVWVIGWLLREMVYTDIVVGGLGYLTHV